MVISEQLHPSDVRRSEREHLLTLTEAGSHITSYLEQEKLAIANDVQLRFIQAESRFLVDVLPHAHLPYAPLLQESKETEEKVVQFPEMTLMLDLSRGGVYSPQFLKEVISHAAEHHYTHLGLYTEYFPLDEYPEVADPESTGMLTKEEIHELALYADQRGLQLYPCLQIFGHMEKLLSYSDLAHLALSDDSALHHPNSKKALNPYNAQSYEFIDMIVRNALEPYSLPGRTTRINLGCDEVAAGSDEEAFLRILNYGAERALAYGAEPQAWADAALHLSDENMTKIHPTLQFVYWNYDERNAGRITDDLIAAKNKGLTIAAVAGSTMSHNQLYPNWEQSLMNINALTHAAVEAKIPGLMITNWHDDYAEAPLSTARGLIEYTGSKRYEHHETQESFTTRYEVFLEASHMHKLETAEKKTTPEITPNPVKMLIYENPHTIPFTGPLPERFGEQLQRVFETCRQKLSPCEPADLLPLRYVEAILAYGATKDHGKDVRVAFMKAAQGEQTALYETIAKNAEAQEHLLYLWMTHYTLWHREKGSADWKEMNKRYATALEQLVTLSYALTNGVNKQQIADHLTTTPNQVISGFPYGNREYPQICEV